MNKYFANQKELLTVASIIFAEVEYNSDIILLCESIKAIVKVGVNRLQNPIRFKCKKDKDRYTLYDVFTAKGQFSCYPASNQFQKAQNGLITDLKELEMWLKCVSALIYIQSYDCDYMPKLTSNHYYNPKLCSPNWAKNKPVDYVVGGHNFLTL